MLRHKSLSYNYTVPQGSCQKRYRGIRRRAAHEKVYAEAGRRVIGFRQMIRNIIFDLGNVLVNVEYERFQKKIYESGVDEARYMDFFKGGNYRLLGYESGDI